MDTWMTVETAHKVDYTSNHSAPLRPTVQVGPPLIFVNYVLLAHCYDNSFIFG
jgi:hypothetical protein